MTRPIHLVWFKRDLRTADHAPLAEAAAAGPVLALHIVEPEYWTLPDTSARHWAHLADALQDLDAQLKSLGGRLTLRTGDAVQVLAALHAERPLAAIHAHAETGNAWTYARDRRVLAWAKENGVPVHETPSGGIQRPLRSRDGWAREWERRAALPQIPVPKDISWAETDPGALPSAAALGLSAAPNPQPAGRAAGLETLVSFLHHRGARYHKELSSPLTAYDSCSRLSVHLAWGTLSTREVVQATRARLRDLKGETDADSKAWRKALGAFDARLHWRCHFMQKLESAPRFETENVHPGFDGARDPDPDPDALAAWAEGHTGIPFLDACMRALNATGWINFRMRAMLQACASYHMWMHWRPTGLHLARQFTDYEPGIHWNQAQMQSGTTGINTVRIYNPVKQGKDHDPDGAFIRRWVPELRDLASPYVHEPWRLETPPAAYPPPRFDPPKAAKAAKDRVYALRRGPGFRDAADAIQAAHGSRRSGLPQIGATSQRAAKRREARAPDPRQGRFDL